MILLSAASIFGAASGVGAEAARPPAGSPGPAPVVREVRVELSPELPGVVAERIRSALAAVAEKALKGQDVAAVERLRPAVEKTVAEVFGRVLSGYATTGVTIVPGETTEVRLAVTPAGPVIREVYTRLEVSGIDPALQPLVTDGLASLDEVGLKLLGGLPVQALSWARFALEPLLAAELQRRLPGFQVATEFEAGEVTTVAARLVPQGELVRRVNVRLTSDSIPAVALRQMNAELDARAGLMKGLPVAFLEAYREPIQREIDRRVSASPSISRWGLAVRSRLAPGAETLLELGVESTAWRLRLEGVLNIGTTAPPPELRLSGGRTLGPVEALVATQLALTTLEQRLQFGVGLPAGWGGELSYLWDAAGTRTARLRKRISAIHRYGVEWVFPEDEWQVSYGVAAGEHLTAELVLSRDAAWVAVVGNL